MKSWITDFVEGDIIVLETILTFPFLSLRLFNFFKISLSTLDQDSELLLTDGPFNLELLYRFKIDVDTLGINPPFVKLSFLPFSQMGLPSLDLTKTLAKSFPS